MATFQEQFALFFDDKVCVPHMQNRNLIYVLMMCEVLQIHV